MSESNAKPVYLVVGACGGLGTAVAERLQSRGADLVLVGREETALTSLAEKLGTQKFVADASDFGQVDAACQATVEQFGRLDGAVCATGSLLLKPAHITSAADWQALVAANLTAAFALVRSAAKVMAKSGGSIVLVSSVAAKTGMSNHDGLSAVKAGVEGLVRSAAASYSRQNIRVNCVAPGIMETNLTRKVVSNSALLSGVLQLYPLARVGQPTEIAGVIDWLLSQESSWVTGQSLSVDGGLSSIRTIAR